VEKQDLGKAADELEGVGGRGLKALRLKTDGSTDEGMGTESGWVTVGAAGWVNRGRWFHTVPLWIWTWIRTVWLVKEVGLMQVHSQYQGNEFVNSTGGLVGSGGELEGFEIQFEGDDRLGKGWWVGEGEVGVML
jgi:hypothetical protein